MAATVYYATDRPAQLYRSFHGCWCDQSVYIRILPKGEGYDLQHGENPEHVLRVSVNAMWISPVREFHGKRIPVLAGEWFETVHAREDRN